MPRAVAARLLAVVVVVAPCQGGIQYDSLQARPDVRYAGYRIAENLYIFEIAPIFQSCFSSLMESLYFFQYCPISPEIS